MRRAFALYRHPDRFAVYTFDSAVQRDVWLEQQPGESMLVGANDARRAATIRDGGYFLDNPVTGKEVCIHQRRPEPGQEGDFEEHTYPVGIVGELSFQDAIRKTRPGECVTISHEPENPFDSKALRVDNALEQTIGYIPRDSWLHRAVHQEKKRCESTSQINQRRWR